MAGEEWGTVTIESLLESGAITGHKDGNHGSQYPRVEEFGPVGIPFLTAKSLSDGKIDIEGAPRLANEKADALRLGFVQPGDVLLSHNATVGRVAMVPEFTGRVLIGTSLTYFRVDPSKILPRYLAAYFSGSDFQNQLAAVMSQTTRNQVPITAQRRLRIALPSLPEQRAIAHILGTLDDRIELNRWMNETLEALARALFKSWFVDFDLVRAKAEGRDPGLPKEVADLFPDSFEDSEVGEIPEGWEVTSVGFVADVIDCLHSKKPDRLDAGMPLLQLVNIRDDGLIDMEDIYLIHEADYRKWVSRMEASPGDCVITNVGRVGAVAQMPVGQKAALGRNMTGIRCKPAFPYPTVLIECLLSQATKDEIVLKMDTGTILDALNVRSIPRLRFVRPRAREILQYFEQKVRPLRAQMETHLAESRTLAALRDALLPKLISGELWVKQMEPEAA